MSVLKNVDLKGVLKLDELRNEDGTIKTAPAAKFIEFGQDTLSAWCAKHGYYVIPSKELVAYLAEIVEAHGRKNCLEIGAGTSGLGQHLGIHQTDSFMQHNLVIASYYKVLGQNITQPQPTVERIDGNSAVVKYKPRVVVASWVTQLGDGETSPSNPWGVDEHLIISQGVKYVLVGNMGAHGGKTIMAIPHKKIMEPWIVSRSVRPKENFIAIWN
jgi:hypothetical protein